MGKTISEKIFSNHCRRPVKAGDFVVAEVDFAMGQDGTSALAIQAFQAMGGKKIFHSQNVGLVVDHNSPSPQEGVSNIHARMREFARDQDCYLYDVGEGICHQVIMEKGHVFPGDLVVGADSHTCTYGALNAFATGVGSTDLAAVWISGKLWFRVPETIRIVLEGELPSGVYAKDLILYLIGKFTSKGANYQAVEFTGSTISSLSMEARFTVANMVVEMGAKTGIMPADNKLLQWLKSFSRHPFSPVEPDPQAVYEKVVEFDISRLDPRVARPHAVDNVCSVEEVAGTPIQQAVLGTCTNGRLEDLRIAARILQGRRVASGVRFIVAPASRGILLQAIQEGIISTLIEAGAAVVTPGCGPCVGTHNGIPADGDNVISSANRNFKGRMGNARAFIYLASPATVAASAITGEITNPRKFL